MSEWISVKDRLPEIDTKVLVYERDDIFLSYLSEGDEPDWFGAYNNQNITHWMPLPEPPGRLV